MFGGSDQTIVAAQSAYSLSSDPLAQTIVAAQSTYSLFSDPEAQTIVAAQSTRSSFGGAAQISTAAQATRPSVATGYVDACGPIWTALTAATPQAAAVAGSTSKKS